MNPNVDANDETSKLQKTLKELKSHTLWLKRLAFLLVIIEGATFIMFMVWKDQLRFLIG